jgi:hypothetical protein
MANESNMVLPTETAAVGWNEMLVEAILLPAVPMETGAEMDGANRSSRHSSNGWTESRRVREGRCLRAKRRLSQWVTGIGQYPNHRG